ncbi:DUF211 domain-containing protein [Candidatus Bathyarchaeota archaeon]|nr:DUF211 domain-containing protein [Candidatus Bathyarchaeota archaeon]
MQIGVRKLVLDVLKSHEPSLPELATRLNVIEGVQEVNISLVEIDQNTESVKITLEGENIDFDAVSKCLIDNGAVIHSVDEVSVSKEPDDRKSTRKV